MSVVLDEHKIYLDSAGVPLSGGFLTFGTVNADPVANLITVYSDRELTTPLTNPVTLNSSGQSSTKIWVDGKYSLRVSDSADVQIYQDLDNGEDSGGLTSVFVSSISGSDVIVGTTSQGLTSYTADQAFQFTTAASPNTTNVTLNIDGVGEKAVVRDYDVPLIAGELSASQSTIVMYNAINDNFELVTQKGELIYDQSPQLGGTLFANGNQVRLALGADIVSAAELPLGSDGNTFNVTGTTTITSMSSLSVGTRIILRFASVLTLTDSTDLELLSDADIITQAGDLCEFYQKSSTGWRMTSYGRRDGSSLTSPTKATGRVNGSAGTFAKETGFSGIVRDDVGDWTLTLDDARPDTNYLVFLQIIDANADSRDSIVENPTSKTTTSFKVHCRSVVNADIDHDFNVMVVDQ